MFLGMRGESIESWKLAQYQVVASRRANYEQLVWQVPLLALTAQAFLLTTSLNQSEAVWVRICTAVLGMLVCVMSMALMARHRQGVEFDSHWLAQVEESTLGLDSVMHGEQWARKRDREVLRVPGGRLGPLTKQYRLWMCGMAIFGLASLVALVGALIQVLRWL